MRGCAGEREYRRKVGREGAELTASEREWGMGEALVAV